MSDKAAKNLRVALYNVTTTTKVGGVESFVWEIAARLAERGYAVDVIGGRGSERRSYPGVRVITLPYLDREFWRRIPLIGRDFTFTKLLERLSFGVFGLPVLLWRNYDIVHIQKPYDLPVSALARLFGRKVVFGCHGKDFWLGDKPFVRFTDAAVAASYFNAEQVRERYQIDPVVIYNGVDVDRFNPEIAPHEDAVLARLGLDQDVAAGRHNILWVGRLIKWKGFEYLIEALPKVAAPGLRLWVAGSGTFQPDLEALAAKLGVSAQIRFLGNVPQEDLPALYHAADLVAATSFVNETFGIALAEAMACGRPVVASNFGGFAEVVDDNVTGLLTPPQDSVALAVALNTLLADHERAERMGKAGRERVTTLFTWDAVVDRLEPVYKAALHKGKDGGPAMTGKKAQAPTERYLYVAYTLSLTLKAANAIQTYQTFRNLSELAQAQNVEVKLALPRWLGEKSVFGAELGPAVVHLPRIAFNKLTRFWKSSVFSYAERTAFSFELLAWILWRRLRGKGFQAIYVRDVVCAFWLLRLGLLAGAKVVYEAHDLEQTNPSRARSGVWRRWLEGLDNTVLSRSAKVVSLTAEFKRFLVDRGLRRANDIAVIPDAFDDTAQSDMSQQEARAQLGLPQNVFVVGYAGLTFAYRRLDLLLDAFAELAKGTEQAILALVGGRPAELTELRQQAKRLGITVVENAAAVGQGAAVIMPGQLGQEQVTPWLYAADVLAIPDTVSSITASPLKLFEYMAAGKPIVLRELPALREILDDSSGLFFPAGDKAALVMALRQLRADPALRARLGAAAKQRAKEYTYHNRAKQVFDLLRSMA